MLVHAVTSIALPVCGKNRRRGEALIYDRSNDLTAGQPSNGTSAGPPQSQCREGSIARDQPPLDQPPDRLRPGRLRLRLAFDPGGDLGFQLVQPADGTDRVAAGRGAAAGSFLYFGY